MDPSGNAKAAAILSRSGVLGPIRSGDGVFAVLLIAHAHASSAIRGSARQTS